MYHQYCLVLTHKFTPSPSLLMFTFNLKQIVRKVKKHVGITL